MFRAVGEKLCCQMPNNPYQTTNSPIKKREEKCSRIHRDWFGDRKDLLRKNFGPSVGRYVAFVQYLHGSFWTIATSCSTGSWIQYAGHICSSVGTAGRLFYRTHVHCDVWMRRSSQDIGSLGWSSYDYVILHVNRRPSGRWDKVWLKTRYPDYPV